VPFQLDSPTLRVHSPDSERCCLRFPYQGHMALGASYSAGLAVIMPGSPLWKRRCEKNVSNVKKAVTCSFNWLDSIPAGS